MNERADQRYRMVQAEGALLASTDIAGIEEEQGIDLRAAGALVSHETIKCLKRLTVEQREEVLRGPYSDRRALEWLIWWEEAIAPDGEEAIRDEIRAALEVMS